MQPGRNTLDTLFGDTNLSENLKGLYETIRVGSGQAA